MSAIVSSPPFHMSPCSTVRHDGVWRIAIKGKSVLYQATGVSQSLPPSSGWTVADGSAPAPSHVQPTC